MTNLGTIGSQGSSSMTGHRDQLGCVKATEGSPWHWMFLSIKNTCYSMSYRQTQFQISSSFFVTFYPQILVGLVCLFFCQNRSFFFPLSCKIKNVFCYNQAGLLLQRTLPILPIYVSSSPWDVLHTRN